MDYNKKVPQQINDVVGDNLKKLAQLFPSAVKDGEVDFEALKEGLGTFTEVGTKKRRMNIVSNSRKKNKTFDVAEGSDLQIEATGRNGEGSDYIVRV